jgi:hypothetical protein
LIATLGSKSKYSNAMEQSLSYSELSLIEADARDKAKRLIKYISEEHGNIEDEDWEKLDPIDPEVEASVEFTQRGKDEVAASSIRT